MKIKSHNMNPQFVTNQHISKLGLSWQELFNPSLAIHANRELNMAEIKLVGFDMDYTLAVYKKSPMESLQYDLAKQYLIDSMGYPSSLTEIQFDKTLLIRGLVIDKHLGNVLKLDDQNYVWRAMHCRQTICIEQTAHLYGSKRIKVGDERYYSLDTFFSIPEACLFIDTVEQLYKIKKVTNIADKLNHHDYVLNFEQIFNDIRIAMDTIHSNGSLKSVIKENIENFIVKDGEIEIALKKLKQEGKKLFLLTNSSLDYTNTVLNFVFDCNNGKSWMELFDLIIVEAQKPLFFTEDRPFDTISQSTARPRILSGGNIKAFHQIYDVRGQEVLYVGDHIYGDILRSKKDSLWRTCLIIKELNFDIKMTLDHKHDFKTLRQIHNEQSQADKRLMRLRTLLGMLQSRLLHHEDEVDPELQVLVDELKGQIKHSTAKLQKLKLRHLKLNRKIEDKFHQRWGRLFKENQELSRFGAQVSQYACIYTDHIKNFIHYGANHIFFARKEQMTHEIDLE